MRRSRVSLWIAAAAVAAGLGGVSSTLASVIYGGPTYDTTTASGYLTVPLPHDPGKTAGDAVGVVNASAGNNGTSSGSVAVRWNTTGFTELGNLGTDNNGAASSGAVAINASGTVIGNGEKYSGSAIGGRAIRWNAGGTAAVELAGLVTGGTNCNANAINNSGTAVGSSYKYNGGTFIGVRAVRWDAGGTAATELGNVGTDNTGSTDCVANDLNSVGTAVGFADKYTGNSFVARIAVRWDAGGTVATELSRIGADGNPFTVAYAYTLNTSGTSVGYGAKASNAGYRAVRWNAGGTAATELDNLGTDRNGNTNSQALTINDAGTVAGYAEKYVGVSDRGSRAVRWSAGGTAATELGNLGTSATGFTNSQANAIGASGTIVGYANAYLGGTFIGQRAVIWGADGTAIDLDTLLSPTDAGAWTLREADGISDTNWVTGIGTFDPDGAGPLPSYQRAFLIQVPEPSALALLGLSFVGSALRTIRRQRESAA